MLGILGGTFDPIHIGHLHIAEQVDAQLRPRQVHFMPCAIPVHRATPRVSAQHRCAMIELALCGHDSFILNRLELEREGPSYSVDSLRELRRQHDDRLLLVLGADAFNGFAGWKSPDEILRLAHLVVCWRPGHDIDANLYREHHVRSAQELCGREAGAILPLQMDACECSSSSVREALRQGETPRRCLSPAVADYIDEHNLYRKAVD